MVIKVKHDELRNVQNVMKTDGELYDEEIKNMLEQVEKLRNIWQGDDAVQFCDHLNAYVTKMKNIPIALRNMSTFMEKTNNGFCDKDQEFSKELETEANNYDEQGSDNGFSTVPGSN